MSTIPRHIQAKQLRAGGMRLHEIAVAMGISKGTVGAHLFYDANLAAIKRREKSSRTVGVKLSAKLIQLARERQLGPTAIAQRLLDVLAKEPVLVANLLDEGDE